MPVFFDTNVLVYCIDPRDTHKQARAQHVVRQASLGAEGVISTQVLIELYNVLGRKLRDVLKDQDAYRLCNRQIIAGAKRAGTQIPERRTPDAIGKARQVDEAAVDGQAQRVERMVRARVVP